MNRLTCGLIGSHISATRLPAALEIMCETTGLELTFTLIDTAELDAFDLEDRVVQLRDQGWNGVTVTHPHKTSAAALAGQNRSEDILRIGAANTLIFSQHGMEAHNTDYSGFIDAWRSWRGDSNPGRVAMAGCGGVARAIGLALSTLGAEDIAVWDVAPERAEKLARDLGPPVRAIPIAEAATACRLADGLVNATAVGMLHSPGMAFDTECIHAQDWAFDAIYTPIDTLFLESCRTSELDCLSGFELFRYMALGSFTAYTGLKLDPALILERIDQLAPRR